MLIYKFYLFLGSYSGFIRLVPEGTIIFNLNQTEFIDQLLQEISLILPVDLDRLRSERPYKIDISTSSAQLIIPLQIKSTSDLSKRNAHNLRGDLNVMIQNKRFTAISMHPHTSLL